MARITRGLATSHIPAVGAAIDHGKTDRAVLEAGLRRVRVDQGVDRGEERPDVIILVYNDHASAFSLELMPTFALGCADRFRRPMRGTGHARCRSCQATPTWPGHLAAGR